MTTPQAARTRVRSIDLSAASAALWLSVTAFLALLALYFVGVDQGAVSLFGSDSTCTSSCMTHGIYSASPATNRATGEASIGRGLLAGAVAGVLAFVFARSCAEPVIGRAIAFEDGSNRRREWRMAAPRAWRRVVHPRSAGKHRLGLRRARFRRCDGRIVRRSVLRRRCTRGACWTTRTFGASGGGLPSVRCTWCRS